MFTIELLRLLAPQRYILAGIAGVDNRKFTFLQLALKSAAGAIADAG
jgi:hypothetical protein